jgi:hypothetical protein
LTGAGASAALASSASLPALFAFLPALFAFAFLFRFGFRRERLRLGDAPRRALRFAGARFVAVSSSGALGSAGGPARAGSTTRVSLVSCTGADFATRGRDGRRALFARTGAGLGSRAFAAPEETFGLTLVDRLRRRCFGGRSLRAWHERGRFAALGRLGALGRVRPGGKQGGERDQERQRERQARRRRGSPQGTGATGHQPAAVLLPWM